MAATLREVGEQVIESLAKAVENMLLPLAQKMGKVIGRSSKQIRTELVDGCGNTYGFGMARKESNENWLVRILYYDVMFYNDKPFQLGVVAFLEAHE